jgi:predicted nuclease of predicted toxin-antitoxin system
MKLLLDENLSDRIVKTIIDLYPDSTHVKTVGMSKTEDMCAL